MTVTWMKPELLIVIPGPTCAGKTGISIELAEELGTEILSADSRQIYREMNIGTAKPNREQLNRIPHHFIGTVSIHRYYSASRYEKEALATLEKIFRDHDAAIMTGGSGLYIDAVCRGIDELPDMDRELRHDLIRQYRESGIEHIRRQLKLLDPEYYSKVDLNNPKRILKALEVSLAAGKPYSSFLTGRRGKRRFGILKIGLQMERNELYRRINRRVDRMVQQGLFEEAGELMPFRHLNALNTVGYKEAFDFLEGRISRERAVELMKRNTRHYARRQLTWFRRDRDIIWKDAEDLAGIRQEILRIK